MNEATGRAQIERRLIERSLRDDAFRQVCSPIRKLPWRKS